MADRFEELAKQPTDRFEQLAIAQKPKPSLSLGKTVMNEAEQFLQTPFKGIMDTANAVTGAALYPVSKLANWGTAGYGKLTGDPNWKENAYQAEQTIQGLNPVPTGQQAFGGQPSPLQQGGEAFSNVYKPAEYVKEKGGYVPGEIAEQFTNYLMGRPTLKSTFSRPDAVPFKGTLAEGLNLRPSATKKGMAASAVETVSDLPIVREYTNRLRRPINETAIGALDEVSSKLKDKESIRAFDEQKKTLYKAAIDPLPDTPMPLPNVSTYLADNLATNKKLSAGAQGKIIDLLKREKDQGGFTKADIESITASTELKAIRKPLQNTLFDDLESINPDAVKAYRKANQEYKYTSKSKAFNDFREKVTIWVGSEEIIDPVKWKKNYENFRGKTKSYHPDLVKQLDKIDELVNIAKDDLGAYKEWKQAQGKGLERLAGTAIAGGSVIPAISPYSLPIAGGIGAGGLLTHSAYKPQGIVNKALTGRTGELVPFELRAINDRMRNNKK
jgi:hypothetical protein